MSDWTRERNEPSFVGLFERYHTKLLKYVRWIISDGSAEDVVQEVFEKLFLHPERFDHNQSFATWLFVLAKHQALSNNKKESTRKKYQQVIVDVGYESELHNEWDEKKARIKSAIAQLPRNHVEIISLKYSSNFSLEEIGTILNISKGTVKSRLHYGLLKLKQIVHNKKTQP